MMPVRLLLAVSIVFCASQFALGLSNLVQITPDLVGNTPFVITATPVAEGLNYSFIYEQREPKKASYSAYLKLYNGDDLVAVCPIEKYREDKFLICEFTVAEKYLKGSRFIFTEDVSGAPSITQFWFDLRDFAKVRKKQ